MRAKQCVISHHLKAHRFVSAYLAPETIHVLSGANNSDVLPQVTIFLSLLFLFNPLKCNQKIYRCYNQELDRNAQDIFIEISINPESTTGVRTWESMRLSCFTELALSPPQNKQAPCFYLLRPPRLVCI